MADEAKEILVELTSKDNQTFKVKKQVILMSGLIKDMLDDGTRSFATMPWY